MTTTRPRLRLVVTDELGIVRGACGGGRPHWSRRLPPNFETHALSLFPPSRRSAVVVRPCGPGTGGTLVRWYRGELAAWQSRQTTRLSPFPFPLPNRGEPDKERNRVTASALHVVGGEWVDEGE